MPLLDYEARRLETSKIIKTAMEKAFGHIPPFSELYLPMSRFNMAVCEEIERKTLEWEARIRADYETNPRWRRKHTDGSIQTDTWGREK